MSKVALIFPGQGSQCVGMGRELFLNFKVAKKTFEKASDAMGLDIKKLAFEGPENELNLTSNTQPAILVTSIAALEVLKSEAGIKGEIVAGHSLGEYTALVHSEVMTFTDAVRTVRKRGAFMQEAVPEGKGAMAAILGMDKSDVESVCRKAAKGEVVSPANFNCPGQIVIAGHRGGVERAVELAREMGAKRAVMLPVSVPSHCSLMGEAADRLRDELEALSLGKPGVPVVSNADAVPYPSPKDAVDILVRQLSSPVRWDESMLYLRNEGINTVIEVGPGKVLSGLAKRIDRELRILNIEDVKSLKKIKAEKL